MARPKRVGTEIIIHEDSHEQYTAASDIDEEAEQACLSESSMHQDDLDAGGEETDDCESDSVLEDIERFQESFKDISERYKLMGRIGEGTFSTVYKAQDVEYGNYRNEWAEREPEAPSGRVRQQARFVAIKKIYATSSPTRILNELEILHELRDVRNVCPLITSFRHLDQVIVILPYFEHTDFRDYYRDMVPSDIRVYFRSLFQALEGIHQHAIVHRDIKPTNFLYNPKSRRGMLVDFGLAERAGTDYQPCLCEYDGSSRKRFIVNSAHAQKLYGDLYETACYPKPERDTRHSKRANRAGTRGFRAPEVLFKCTAQNIPIDIWSAGVILLTIMARRFPFFHSTDDIDAVLELVQLFGKAKMRVAALLHGQLMDTTIPSYNEAGHSLEKIILWSTNRAGRDAMGNKLYNLDREELLAADFLEKCLDLDPWKRIGAKQALQHPFLLEAGSGDADEDLNLVWANQ